MNGVDTITVLRARGGKRLAKLIRRDGTIEDYNSAFTYDLFERPVADLTALHRLLVLLLHRPDCCIVRGAPIDPERTINVRRRAYPDKKTGDQPTLRDVPHCWCALDMDGIERPECLPATDLPGCAAEAIRRLPIAFGRAACIVQASASHGIKSGCQLRLWYWLDRPTAGDELTRWLSGRLADPAVFRTAQPIYTAAPVFESGGDHLPQRAAVLPGEPLVPVPARDALTPPPRQAAHTSESNAGRTPIPQAQLEQIRNDALNRVRAARDGKKHSILRNSALLIGGIAEQGGFSNRAATQWLIDSLPSSVKDAENARKTAEWGLENGRAKSISLEERPKLPPDPRRRETARTAFRLLHRGATGAELLSALHALNQRRPDPLPPEVIADTALWAARQLSGQQDAR